MSITRSVDVVKVLRNAKLIINSRVFKSKSIVYSCTTANTLSVKKFCNEKSGKPTECVLSLAITHDRNNIGLLARAGLQVSALALTGDRNGSPVHLLVTSIYYKSIVCSPVDEVTQEYHLQLPFLYTLHMHNSQSNYIQYRKQVREMYSLS